MRLGQRIIYKDNILGNIKGTILHKTGKDKVMIKLNDEIYGNFQKAVHINEIYKCRN